MIPTIIVVVVSGIINTKLGFVWHIALIGDETSTIGAGLLILLYTHSDSAEHIGLLILPGIAFGAAMQSSLMGVQLQVNKKDSYTRPDFISVTTLNAFNKALGTATGGVLSDTIFGVSVAVKFVNSQKYPIKQANELISYIAFHYDGPGKELSEITSGCIRNVFHMALGISALILLFSVFAP
ncbi:hypothetical protein BZL39_K05130 [Zygosaccharomyces parabailii]|nr:hypothetical protein BZL39_K05130 [Zygosaccharomyces parabailii]